MTDWTLIVLGVLNGLLSTLSSYAYLRIRISLKDLRDTKLDLVDLTERFERFQSRESMRKARDTKHSDAEVQAELAKLATAAPVQLGDTKQALRRRLRGMQ